jgi:hypothetical protein
VISDKITKCDFDLSPRLRVVARNFLGEPIIKGCSSSEDVSCLIKDKTEAIHILLLRAREAAGISSAQIVAFISCR